MLLRKREPTGLPVLLRVHFYKLDEHIHLKPKINKLSPSTHSTFGCPSSPWANAYIEILPCLSEQFNSISEQIECRHTSNKGKHVHKREMNVSYSVSPKDWWSDSDGQYNMEGGRVERALDQITPYVNVLDKAIPSVHPTGATPFPLASTTAAGSRLHTLLCPTILFLKQRSNCTAPLLTHHPWATSACRAGFVSWAKFPTTQTPLIQATREGLVLARATCFFPPFSLLSV